MTDLNIPAVMIRIGMHAIEIHNMRQTSSQSVHEHNMVCLDCDQCLDTFAHVGKSSPKRHDLRENIREIFGLV